jgi:threonine aldolase
MNERGESPPQHLEPKDSKRTRRAAMKWALLTIGILVVAVAVAGFFTAEELEAAVQPRVYWAPRTALVSIENTHNRNGGRVWPPQQARAVAERARALGFATHLDGARIWNASVASGLDVSVWCAPFDTVSVCFSKGLGAPVGSAFCGTREVVAEARRFRKRWGGGMRQSGILAAGALHALAHHRVRLAEDHVNARLLAEKLAGTSGMHVELTTVETNLVNVDLDVPADAVARRAGELGVLVNASAPRRLRVVTHLDVSRADVDVAADVLAQAVANVQ